MDTAKKKREVIALAACDLCKTSKVRCVQEDGSERCQKCQKAGVDCTFSSSRAKTGWTLAGGSALAQAKREALEAAQIAIDVLHIDAPGTATLPERDFSLLGDIIFNAQMPDDDKVDWLNKLIAALMSRAIRSPDYIEQARRVRQLLDRLGQPEPVVAEPQAPFKSTSFDFFEHDMRHLGLMS